MSETQATEARELDPDKVVFHAFTVFSQLQGFMLAGAISVGERLGLYRALAGHGPMSAAELAEATGLHERWVAEWLRTQGAARLLEIHGDERFELTPEGAAVLADTEHLAYAAHAFRALDERAARFEDAVAGMQTGLGRDFDSRGEAGAELVEATFGNWHRQMLVPVMLPGLDGVEAKLAAGARVADVGCGTALALIEIAQAFPDCELHGYDISEYALARARANIEEAGVTNVVLHDPREEPLFDDGSVDLVMTLDCIHDMTHPDEMVAALRAAVAEDGTWLWGEPKAQPTYADDVERNPMAALMYANSLFGCLSSGLSEPGGAGLGTLGIPERKAREMAAAAGFTRFEVRDFDNPVNIYFEVKP